MSREKDHSLVFEADMDAAVRRHFKLHHAEALDDSPLPGDRIMDVDLRVGNGAFGRGLLAEDDGFGGAPGEYEMRQRVLGVRGFLRFIKRRGATPEKIMRELFAAGRAVHDPYFSGLSMTETALMFSETKAAQSWRCKVLSGEIKLGGMNGTRLPGQKSPESSASYRASAMGNSNRASKKTKKKGKMLSWFQKV